MYINTQSENFHIRSLSYGQNFFRKENTGAAVQNKRPKLIRYSDRERVKKNDELYLTFVYHRFPSLMYISVANEPSINVLFHRVIYKKRSFLFIFYFSCECSRASRYINHFSWKLGLSLQCMCKRGEKSQNTDNEIKKFSIRFCSVRCGMGNA